LARILIVDDEKDVGRTLKMILENYGFDVDYFTDPAAALEQFKPSLYDLTILDIRMPDPNGFKLYSELKSRDPNIKGKRHFVTKPVSNEELLKQVYSLLVPQEEYEEVV
jgi:CheY-like chemotaxis protein